MTVEERNDWQRAAASLISSLQGYEDAHPTGAPCFRIPLEEAERQYALVFGGDAA